MEADQRRPGQRALQDDRRRRALDEDFLQSRLCDRHAREDRRLRGAERSARRLRDRAGQRRRRLPLRTTAARRGSARTPDEAAPARILLHRDLSPIRRIRRSPTRRKSTASTRRTTAARRLRSIDHAARRQSHHLDQSAPPERSCWSATTAAVPYRSTAATTWSTRAQSADRAVLSRCARRSVSVPRLRRVAGRGRVRRPERRGRRRASASATGITVALGESTFVAPEPGNPEVTYGSGYYSSFVQLQPHHRRREERQSVAALYGRRLVGRDEVSLRLDASDLLLAGRSARVARRGTSRLLQHRSRPDVEDASAPISRATIRSTEGPSGGPVYLDQTGAETFPDIASLAVSPLDANVIWAGSADGLVHVTTDHGAHWKLGHAAGASAVGADQLDRALAYRTRAPPISRRRATCGTTTIRTSTRRPTTARIGRR